MNKTWFKYTFTDEEFADIIAISKLPNGIALAADKYNVNKGIIRSRIKSNNIFKGIPPQNKLKYSYNDSYFLKNKDSLCYLMGLLASDGSYNGSRLGFNQSHFKGKRIIYFIKGLINSTHKIYKYKNSYSINIKPDVNFKKCLSKFNIIKNKTYNYTLPNFTNINQFYYFLQGYIEGDGCIGYYDNGRKSFTLHISIVGTKPFIFAVNEKLPVKGKIQNIKNDLFQLSFNGLTAFKVLTLIYNRPIYVAGKYKNFIKNTTKYIEIIKSKCIYKQILIGLKQKESPLELSKKFNLRLGFIYNLKWKTQKLQKNWKNRISPKD